MSQDRTDLAYLEYFATLPDPRESDTDVVVDLYDGDGDYRVTETLSDLDRAYL